MQLNTNTSLSSTQNQKKSSKNSPKNMTPKSNRKINYISVNIVSVGRIRTLTAISNFVENYCNFAPKQIMPGIAAIVRSL